MASGGQQRGMRLPGGLVSVITWTITLQPPPPNTPSPPPPIFQPTRGAVVCSTWQVHKSPGRGDCDMARPWGPDALSTSTAEPAADASRPSTHASPARSNVERAQNVHKHTGMKNKESLPSITPPTSTSAAYTPPFPPFFSFIFTHWSWLGQRTVGKEMASPERWPLTPLWIMLLLGVPEILL